MDAVIAMLKVVLAQAGGGGSFGGGGGGGGGGFSGGGGGFSGGGFSGGGGGGGGADLPPGVIAVIVVVWIAISIAGRYGQQRHRGTVTRTIRQGRKVQEQLLQHQALTALRQRDPEFNEGVFLQRSANAFVTTQYAWSEQVLTPCRPFVSDGVHERFDLYIGMQKVEGIRNRMKDVNVVGASIVAVTTDTHFDTIHVRFTASAISYNESLASGKRVSGNSDRAPIQFTEIWSFSRRPGVRTRAQGASLLEGGCPNCGVPLQIADRAQCIACAAIVNSGEHDWVLSEITQDEEWIVPPARHDVPGWAELAQRDPGLNVQHLEDRASVIYWRSMMAVYHGNFDFAAPVLPVGAIDVPPLWRPTNGGWWYTPAVGSVEIQRADPAGGPDDPVDRIHVQVRWSATMAKGAATNPETIVPQRIYTHVLILRRNAGVTSNLSHAFTSFSCTNCGGPLDVGKATACQFCATPINDGSTDWVLEDVVAFSSMRAYLAERSRDAQLNAAGGVERLETDRFLNEPELLVAVAHMVMADGVLHDHERDMITQLAESRGVSGQRLDHILAAGADPHQDVPLPKGEEQAQAFMLQLIRAALIDGMISKEEQRFMTAVGSNLGWTARDISGAIKSTRKTLYGQAKQIIQAAEDEGLPPPPSGLPTSTNLPPPR